MIDAESQGLSFLRDKIEDNEVTTKCSFCNTEIENGPVFFKGTNMPPIHYECLQDIKSFPDLKVVQGWRKRMEAI